MGDYQQKMEKILKDARIHTFANHSPTYKNVFGAVGGYIDDQIFCSCGSFGFALKLPQAEMDKLFDEGAKPLKYFPNGHVKKDYAVLTESMLSDHERLHDLIEKCMQFLNPSLTQEGEFP